MKCMNCGKEAEKGNLFCGFCGAKLPVEESNETENNTQVAAPVSNSGFDAEKEKIEENPYLADTYPAIEKEKIEENPYLADTYPAAEKEKIEENPYLADTYPAIEKEKIEENPYYATQNIPKQSQQTLDENQSYPMDSHSGMAYQQASQPYLQHQAAPNQAAPNQAVLNGAKTADKIGKNTKTGKPGKHKKYFYTVLFSAIALFVVFITLILYLLFRTPTINLNQYASVKFSGYDGMGTADLVFDYNQFLADNEKTFTKLKKSYWRNFDMFHTLENLLDDIQISHVFEDSNIGEGMISLTTGGTFDHNGDLSNGDTVIYSWLLDDSYLNNKKLKLKYDDIEATVEGLKQVRKFDPFENLKIVYHGIDGQGYLELINEQPSNQLSFRIASDYTNAQLSNGDTVMIALDGYYDNLPQYAENFGTLPQVTEKMYTLDGFSKIITSSSQISDDILLSLQNYADDIFYKHTFDDWSDNVNVESFDYLGNYLLVNKYDGSDSKLVLVYQVTAKIQDEIKDTMQEKEYTYFWDISYNDVEITPEGELKAKSPYDLSYNLPYDNATFEFNPDSWNHYYFSGYATLDELFLEEIKKETFDYTYEENMQ